jgi:hypothetical protein
MSKKKRKTREQKIIAQLRRKLMAKEATLAERQKKHTIEEKSEFRPEVGEEKSLKTEEKKLSLYPEKMPIIGQKEHSGLFTYDLSLVRKDLTKTLALTMLALSLEVLIYFLMEKGGLKSLHFF